MVALQLLQEPQLPNKRHLAPHPNQPLEVWMSSMLLWEVLVALLLPLVTLQFSKLLPVPQLPPQEEWTNLMLSWEASVALPLPQEQLLNRQPLVLQPPLQEEWMSLML